MDGLRKTGPLGLHCQGKTRECACYDGPPLSEPAISCQQDTGSSCPHCRAWMRQGLSPSGTAALSAFGPVSKMPFCPWATCPGFIRACLTHFSDAGEHTTQRAAAFCPGSSGEPCTQRSHQGLRFPERHAKGAYSKKIFAPPVKSFSERPVAMQMQEAAAPLRGRPGRVQCWSAASVFRVGIGQPAAGRDELPVKGVECKGTAQTFPAVAAGAQFFRLHIHGNRHPAPQGT